jgi:hypothetical protein
MRRWMVWSALGGTCGSAYGTVEPVLRRAGFDVVAEASTGEEAIELVDAHEPTTPIAACWRCSPTCRPIGRGGKIEW